jgi:NAD(P)-dependent dehydrogenase (short-subunit alcohol dehydrogenase family)
MRGRRVLVIGAGRDDHGLDRADLPPGNGQATCRLLAREGAAVACADLIESRAAETLGQVEAEGGRGVALGADASREEDVVGLLERAASGLGGLDGLVVNVGIGRGMGLDGTSVADWDATMAVNVRAHFLACKHGLPRLDEGSAIVLVSSIAGARAGSQMPAYDASKAALAGLARHVALEAERRRVRVNVVVPGLIDTPLGRLATLGRPTRTAGRLPLGRQGTPWEVAYASLFLLSAEASYVNGHLLFVDGGLAAIR